MSSVTSSTEILESHLPCSSCGSSDALARYVDHTYCFSCQDYRPLEKATEKPADGFSPRLATHVATPPTQPAVRSILGLLDPSKKNYSLFRSIPASVRKFYGAWQEGDLVVYPWQEGAHKTRHVPTKTFRWHGETKAATLFGKELFNKGSSMAITITEGEEDAMAVYYMQGSKYPSVSVRSSSTARKDCEREYDYLNSFEKIYICFDADDPGRQAAKEVATLFDPNKVYVVELNGGGLKDANDYLAAGKETEFTKLWWAAKKYIPKNIIAGYDQIKAVLEQQEQSSIAHYPFPTLDAMAYGIREGEVVLLTALEKRGKTEVIRSIEAHLLKTTDYNLGIIHLEEGEKRAIQGLVSYQLNVPCHLPDSGVSTDDQLKAFRDLTRKDDRVYIYAHFGSDDPNNILGVIRYLVSVCHCKFVFLDHITMLATGFENDDERKKLDYISTRLAMLTRELRFTLFLVSHVNDEGETRGSRNIGKIADLLVHLDRNPMAESFDERNTTKLMVRGNRFGATSGPAGYLSFDPSTFQISEKTLNHVEEDQPF